MFRQEIIRDKDYNIIEEYDNSSKHIKYDYNGDITYYKIDNFEYPSQFSKITTTHEQDFIDIIKDGVIKIYEVRYPESIFLFKNDKYLFRYDLKSGYIWFSYDIIWSFFESQYSMNDQQIQAFLKDIVERYFNCKEITPVIKSSQ